MKKYYGIKERDKNEKNTLNENKKLKLEKSTKTIDIKKEVKTQKEVVKKRKPKEKEEKEKISKKQKDKDIDIINDLKDNQNISIFLNLIEKYANSNQFDYMIKTLEAISEDTIREKYEQIKEQPTHQIQTIRKTIYYDDGNEINQNCCRKLILILLFYEKSNNNCDEVFNKLLRERNKKSLIFDVLLDFSNDFGEEIKFENKNVYNEFVEYSIEVGKYQNSFDYLSNDIIQLNKAYELREKIFKSNTIVKLLKFDSYDEAFDLVQGLIQFEKEKEKKFILFPRKFWEDYYLYYKNNEEENKLQKYLDLFELLISYSKIEPVGSEYEDELAKIIHEYILNKIEEKNIDVKEQLELLFEKDPFYIYDKYKREPEIFKAIKIYDLVKKEDINYFNNIDFDKIYESSFENFVKVIIGKINKIKDFNFIIKLIKVNSQKNKSIYIELLFEKYSSFNEKDLTKESLTNFLSKIIEYNLGKEYTINYDDFLKKENTKNVKLLTKLIKFKLIPKCAFFEDNQKNLNNIYEKLSSFKEKKSIYLEIILNENEEVQKMFIKKFELFKLAKGKQFKYEEEYYKIKNKFLAVEINVKKAYNISTLLSIYYKVSLKEKIEAINKIYKDYSQNEIEVKEWIYKDKDLIEFIDLYEQKGNLIGIIKELKLFSIIYIYYTEGEEGEEKKFDKAKKLLDECKNIFADIYKGNQDIIKKWYNIFNEEKEIEEELEKLKDYYKIDDKNSLEEVIKNIMIFTKKNIYHDDIKYLLYFINLFNKEESELTAILKEKKAEFEDEENLNFEKLKKTNDYLEEKEIYINDGKDDSSSIQFIRLLYEKENEIKFAITKDIDSASILMNRINKSKDSLKLKDILEYQYIVEFLNDFKETKTDQDLLNKLREKLSKLSEDKQKNKIDKELEKFNNYFKNFQSIKSLDTNFDSSKDIYQNIIELLNNSKFKIELFKAELEVYDDENRKKEFIAKDLDGLVELKNNINLNFEYLSDSNEVNEVKKEELEEKRTKIKIFIKYIEQLICIMKYFKHLENKGFPFLIDITISSKRDIIKYEIFNKTLSYKEVISKLKEYYKVMIEYQNQFYKENEYFRFAYGKHLYRLFKRTQNRDKDISSYVRFFTNSESINDELPFFEAKFNDPSLAYKNYREAIREKFELISKYIENIFKVNNTSLEKLYDIVKVKERYNLHGVYKCKAKKYNVEKLIIKIFLRLTDAFPIAQNILLTNNETSEREIYSFMNRAIKCKYNALFIISISNDFSLNKLNIMTNLLNRIISEMKIENQIKTIEDLKSCLLFVTSGDLVDFPKEVKILPSHIKGEESKFEYNIVNDDSLNNFRASDKTKLINEIYNHVKIYSSDCCGLGKSNLIKKEIKKKGEEYIYLGLGDDITKGDLIKKLKRLLKVQLKGKEKVGIHLDLFYTKNTPLMQYFLFSILITKFFQVNDNILYIPKKFNIYVEIPNGPQKFLDDFSILQIFKRINISLENQEPLDYYHENLLKSLENKKINKAIIEKINEKINSKKKPMSYVEKEIYIKILCYLRSFQEYDKNDYYEKVEKIAEYFTKYAYSKKLKKSENNRKEELDVNNNEKKTQKEIKDSILDFLNLEEEETKIQYDGPLIFKTKNGYEEISISDNVIKDKKLEYFLEN